jgi:hypothetical protein
MTAVPSRSCEECGEFLPHACAALVEIKQLPFGRRSIVITDRAAPEPESWEAEAS